MTAVAGGEATEEAFKRAFQLALQDARGASLDAARLRPRGIVIPAGGARMFTCAWVAVRMLRDHLKTELPIEIWHIGPQEMSPSMAALMAEQQVKTVDALAHLAEQGESAELGGFELKSYALLNCDFCEVLLLDADNVLLADPAAIFDHPAFAEAGAMFWPDLVSIAKSSRIWELCGIDYRHMPSFESGQLAVDRVRHYPALALSWFLNRNSRLVYRHVYGDKDTFLIAWLALGAAFFLVPHAPKRLNGSYCQHDPEGQRILQHRSGRKWILHGENPAIQGFMEEDRCLSYLAELRGRWTGRILWPPARDEDMTRVFEALLVQRHFRLETVSVRTEAVQLLPGDLMQRRGPAANWWLTRKGDKVLLSIGEDDVICRTFERLAPDYWRSAAARPDEQDQILTAEDDPRALHRVGHSGDGIEHVLTDWHKNYDKREGPDGISL